MDNQFHILPRSLQTLLQEIETKADSSGRFDRSVITDQYVNDYVWLKRIGCIDDDSQQQPRITRIGFNTLMHIRVEAEKDQVDEFRFSIQSIISLVALVLSAISIALQWI